MRAFIYCRVSTKEQGKDDHYSLDNQETRCRDYAKMKGWSVAKVRKDIASGKNDSREGYQELLSDLRENRVDVILVYRLDRLSRNVGDIYDFLNTAQLAHKEFASTSEGFDTTNAMGRAMLGVAAVFAQLTREIISENVKDGLMRRAEEGHFNGNKCTLYGYDYSIEQHTLVVNEAEAETVRLIFEWYTELKWGITKIAKMLNVKGIPAKHGGQWGKNTIAPMLRNVALCGDVRLGDAIITGLHEGIISRELWQTTQAMIESRAVLPPRSHQSKHLLSGIARCSECGAALKAHYTFEKRPDGVRRYVFYKHPRSEKVGPGVCLNGVAKSAPRLEAVVLEHIAEMALSQRLESATWAEVQGRLSGTLAPKRQERDAALLDLAGLGDTFTKWADKLDAGQIDDDQFAVQNRRLLDRKKALQARVAAIDREIGSEGELNVTLEQVRTTLGKFTETWDCLTVDEQREVLRLLVESLTVSKSSATLKLLFHDPIEFSVDFRARLATKPARVPFSLDGNRLPDSASIETGYAMA
jgi:site-specific DNA recombinase